MMCNGRLKTALLISATLAVAVASPAAAQRSVPVLVGNDANDPIPVQLVQSGGAGASTAQYVLCMQGFAGPGVGSAYPGCIEVLALGLSVGRELKESGEKGGTADINIGVGELSPVSIQKRTDGISANLFAFAVNGNSFGQAELYLLEQRPGWPKLLPTMEVVLDRSFVKSMSIDPSSRVETLELYFNKIQLKTFGRDANGNETSSSERCWDVITLTPSCSL